MSEALPEEAMTLRTLGCYAALAALLACINPIADAIVGNGDEFDTVVVHDTTIVTDTTVVPPVIDTIIVTDTLYCHTHDGHRTCR